jgi:hypothetical protein
MHQGIGQDVSLHEEDIDLFVNRLSGQSDSCFEIRHGGLMRTTPLRAQDISAANSTARLRPSDRYLAA